MTTSVRVVPPDQFPAAAAKLLADHIHSALRDRGRCSIALSGGKTPQPVHHELSRQEIRWADLSVYFADERAVPPDHPDSNYRAACESLLDHVPVPEGQVFRMQAERSDRDVAAAEYAEALPERLDLLVLGVGPDGHTCSLFPHRPSLDEHTRRVIAVDSPPAPLTPQVARMTITPVVIAAARHIVVLVTGADRAHIVARALDPRTSAADIPASLARNGWWMLDSGAAAELKLEVS